MIADLPVESSAQHRQQVDGGPQVPHRKPPALAGRKNRATSLEAASPGSDESDYRGWGGVETSSASRAAAGPP